MGARGRRFKSCYPDMREEEAREAREAEEPVLEVHCEDCECDKLEQEWQRENGHSTDIRQIRQYGPWMTIKKWWRRHQGLCDAYMEHGLLCVRRRNHDGDHW